MNLRLFNKTDKLILLGSFLAALFCSLLLYDDSWIFSLHLRSSGETIGQIDKIISDVRKKENKEFLWRKAKRQESIQRGDSIFTGNASVARIRLKDGSDVDLDENSLITFTQTEKQTTLDLKFGALISAVKSDLPVEVKIQGKRVQIISEDNSEGNTIVQLKADGTYSEVNGKVKIKSEKTLIKKDLDLEQTQRLSLLLNKPANNVDETVTPPTPIAAKEENLVPQIVLSIPAINNPSTADSVTRLIHRKNDVPLNLQGLLLVKTDSKTQPDIPPNGSQKKTFDWQKLSHWVIQYSQDKNFQTIEKEFPLQPEQLHIHETNHEKNHETNTGSEVDFGALNNYPQEGSYFVRIQSQYQQKNIISNTLPLEIHQVQDPKIISPTSTPSAPYVYTVKKNKNGDVIPSLLTIDYQIESHYQNIHLEFSSHEDFSDISQKLLLPSNSDSPTKDFHTYLASMETVISWMKKQNLKQTRLFTRLIAQFKNNSVYSNAIPIQVEVLDGPKLESPILSSLKEEFKADHTPPPVAWKKVEFANSYVVEIANDDRFQNKEVFELKDKNPLKYTWKKTFLGKKYLRVYAKNEKGEAGLYSSVAEWIGLPENITLLPTKDKNIQSNNPDEQPPAVSFQLAWKALPMVSEYMIQISSQNDFKNKTEFKTNSSQYKITQENPGHYFWRVKPLIAGLDTKYSPAGEFHYLFEIPLKAPELVSPKDKNTFYFQSNADAFFWVEWKPVRQAEEYEIQIAKDKKFTKILGELKTKLTKYKIDTSYKTNPMYLRVRSTSSLSKTKPRVSTYSEARQVFIIIGRSPSGTINNSSSETEDNDGL